MSKIDAVITMLINEQPLPPERLDHPLKGFTKIPGSVCSKNNIIPRFRLMRKKIRLVLLLSKKPSAEGAKRIQTC
jgi:mRNA-degrading endonuclease YafQ of YafQ-DinJ toxin-antitoxin module